jgi:hypothetical protein
MFNLFGSIFGYGSKPEGEESEAGLQQTECAATATQATQTAEGQAAANMTQSTVTPPDWVIVDRSEGLCNFTLL